MNTTPTWFISVAVLGLVWNVFGAYQFIGSLTATTESLLAAGMTAEQAAVMLGYPTWMTIAFAIGVIGGTIGCILLLCRKKLATPIFASSLLGYIALYIGDITEGVFAALGTPQIAVLTTVVAIAVGLLWFSSYATKRGFLTS